MRRAGVGCGWRGEEQLRSRSGGGRNLVVGREVKVSTWISCLDLCPTNVSTKHNTSLRFSARRVVLVLRERVVSPCVEDTFASP